MNVQIQPHIAVAERHPPFRMHRLGASRWGCSRSLSGRSLRGAGGRRHPSQLGRQHINRGNQRGHYRGQFPEFTRRSPARVLDAGDHRAPLVWGKKTLVWGKKYVPRLDAGRCLATVAQPRERGFRTSERRKRFFLGTTGASVVSVGRNDRGHQLLRHARSEAHVGATRRLRSSQWRRNPLQRRRGQFQNR
jgi:hypothetical protein